jgi:hypothetical protein
MTKYNPASKESETAQATPDLALADSKGLGATTSSQPEMDGRYVATNDEQRNFKDAAADDRDGSRQSSPLGEMSVQTGASAPAAKRKPHEVLARELGISDKTVREKRKLGMSDEDIAVQAAVNSPKHDPLKFKREIELPLLDLAVQDLAPESANGQLRVENLRARRLSNEQEELKLQKMRGELLSIDQVMEEVVPAFVAVRDGMMAMVEKMAPRLATMADPAEIRRHMYSEVLSCFDGLEKLIRAGKPGSAAA